MKVNVLESIFH